MKATLCFPGELAAGLRGYNITICGLSDLPHADHRSAVRDTLAKAFAEIEDGKPRIIFDDECVDCGRILRDDGKCPAAHCPSNAPDDDGPSCPWCGSTTQPVANDDDPNLRHRHLNPIKCPDCEGVGGYIDWGLDEGAIASGEWQDA